MSDDDMNKPVTKREMHDALAKLSAKLSAEFAELKAEFVELKAELAALKSWLQRDFKAEISQAIGYAAGMNADQLRREIALVDDEYKPLPERVNRDDGWLAQRR